MTENERPAWAVLVGGVAGLAIIVLLIGLHAVVAAQLWEWFVVPIGAPVITVAQMVGIRLLIVMSGFTRYGTKTSDTASINSSFLIPVLAYIVGGVVHTVF